MSNQMRELRASRHRAPTEPKLSQTLNKTLQHHQVVPATMSTDAGHTANRPHVLKRNAKISGTGGLRGHQTHHTHSGMGTTLAHSSKDARILQRGGVYIHNPAHGTKGK